MVFVWGAYLFILLAMLTLWYVPNDPSPTDYLAAAAAGMTFASLKFIQKPLQLFYGLLYLFFVANILSMFMAKVPSQAFSNLTTLTFLSATLFVYPTLASTIRQRQFNRVYHAIIAAAVISGTIGFLAYFGVMPGPKDQYFMSELGWRLSPFFQDPNVYSPFLCFGFALALTLFWERKTVLIGFAVATPILLGILLSFSRAGWLNLFVILLVFMVFVLTKQKNVQIKRRMTVMAVSAVGLAVLTFPILVEYLGIAEILEIRTRVQGYDAERFAAQDLAITEAVKRPLGVGPGHYIGRHHFPESDFALDAHNVYLKVLIERGWLGFLTFMGFIACAGLMAMKAIKEFPARSRYTIALLAALVGLLANSYFISSLHWRHFYVLLGLILAEYVMSQKYKGVKVSLPIDDESQPDDER